MKDSKIELSDSIIFMLQDIILIEFQVRKGRLGYSCSNVKINNLVEIGLDSGVVLSKALSFINQQLGSCDTCSYAIVCSNEHNCYVVGCNDFQADAISLIQYIQETNGYETNFQWSIRFLS